MKRYVLCTLVAMAVPACASSEGGANANSGQNSSTNSDPNGSPNNTDPNADPNADPNNGTANADANNGTANSNPNNGTANSNPNNGTANSTPNNNTANNGTTEWRALVANAELTGSESSWTIVVFDGTQASTTVPQSFGSGALAVAASGDRGYVVDLDGGSVLVVDATTGTEIETIELGAGEYDDAASSGGTVVGASGSDTRIVQYSAAAGGLGPEISLGALTGGDPLGVRSVVMDGELVAGVAEESSMFPNPPKVFLADTGAGSLIDLDPNTNGAQGISESGLTRLDRLGERSFAVATEFEGIKILNESGGNWVMQDTLIDAFGSAEVENVIMASEEKGLALTYEDGFQAIAFDAASGSKSAVGGLAVPSGLIGGDASADGAYYFVGDYGVRDEPDSPWGVGIVDTDGMLLDHVLTDEDLPPADIVALD